MELPRFDEVFGTLVDYMMGKEDAIESLAALRKDFAEKSAAQLSLGAYPDIEDPKFNQRLQKIRDFYVINDPAEIMLNAGAVVAKNKQLGKHQRFVKAYMSPKTGYNGLLLVHAVGTGKTCSAVSVAEMYRPIMSKPALVLTKNAVKVEFQKELGAPGSATYTSNGWSMPIGCAGSYYQKVLGSVKSTDPSAVKDALDHVTRLNYSFMGYEAFANQAERIYKKEGIQGLRQEYSDRVVIVDEAHSLRADTESKRSADLLVLIMKHCSNIKLLLMTATPMYDQPKEIVFLLNLLRINDKKDVLDADAMFDKNGGLMVEGEGMLRTAVQGYVSFVRSNDPRLYPTKIMSHVASGSKQSAWPKFVTDGAPVPEFDSLGTVVVRTELVGDQAALVESLKLGSKSVLEDVEAIETNGSDQSLGPSAQASNVVFPVASGKVISGIAGFNATFTKKTVSGVDFYEYKGEDHVLAEPLLSKYAPKIALICKKILESEGITFIYSNWLSGGAIPMAIALEHMGYTRYGSPPLLSGAKSTRGKYMMYTGRASLMSDVDAALNNVIKRSNSGGDIIKVIIATSAATEGVNFKCVRDVHILDSWWNTSKPLQVVGRATRLLSHQALAEDKRNVTVHYHAASLPGDREGIDHFMYRVAANKQKAISRVLRILRDESVDCAWNSKEHYEKPTGDTLSMTTSTGRNIQVPRGNQDGDPECFFGECTVPCSHNSLMEPAKRNAELFQPLSDDVELVRVVLEALFKSNRVLRMPQILSAFPDTDADLVEMSLVELLERDARIKVDDVYGKFAAYKDFFTVDFPESKTNEGVAVPLTD
jgi:hypothetical protein